LLIAGVAGCGAVDEPGTGPRSSDPGPLGKASAEVCTALPPPAVCAMTLWPNGVIPYNYDPAVPGPETTAGTMQANIRNAMNEWQTKTGGRVTFVKSTNDPFLVTILNNNNCNSPIGRGSGPSNANWAPGCPFQHELGHVIGLMHEHQRWDRDRYIEVHPTAPNCDDYQMYFRCMLTDDSPADFGEYDLLSCMQYGSSPAPSDLTLRSNGQPISGGGGGVQPRDVSKVVEMYARENPYWKKGASMGIDVGSLQPLDQTLAPGVTIRSGSSPAIVRGAQHLYAIARGTDNHLYWRFGNPVGEPAWQGWQFIGGTGFSSPSAANYNGTIYLSERTNGVITVYAYNEINGFGAATNIGKPAFTTLASDTAMAGPSGLGLYVFVRTTANQLWYKRMVGTTWDNSWTSLGGSIRGNPGVVSRFSTQLDVFANSSTGDLQQIYFNGSNWSSWFNVPNGSCCLAADAGPAVASPYSDRIDILFPGTDGMLQWKNYTGGSGGYQPIRRLGGILTGNPAAVGMAGPRLDVLTVGDNGGMWHRRHFRHTRGDWNGDGRADFAVYRSSDATVRIHPFGGGADIVKSIPNGNSSTIVRAVDIDADGRTDKVWITPQGQWNWEQSADLNVNNRQFGTTGFVPVIGDFNGDGRDDYAYWSPNDNFSWFIFQNYFGPSYSTQWGASGDIPVAADYDGDGRDDIAVWRPGTGNWHVIPSSTGVGTTWKQWGASEDRPVPGDYDGDGKTDPAIWRPSDSQWHINLSTNPTVDTMVNFGTSTDRMVPRDYDGDGKTDLAYFRPSNGTWNVRFSGNGQTSQITFALSSDTVL
jgi:hypothetical protein